MRRVVSLYLPTWPTDRIRRAGGAPPPDEPLVTVRTEGSRRLIGAVDHNAHALGLRVGQTVAHAQALVPKLHIVEAAPGEDEAALIELARWCIGYSPVVAPCPPDGIWIDIAGSAALFGGEEKLVADLLRRLAAQRHSARGRASPMRRAPPGRWRVLGARPSCRPASRPMRWQGFRWRGCVCRRPIVQGLNRLGIDRIGQLAAHAARDRWRAGSARRSACASIRFTLMCSSRSIRWCRKKHPPGVWSLPNPSDNSTI